MLRCDGRTLWVFNWRGPRRSDEFVPFQLVKIVHSSIPTPQLIVKGDCTAAAAPRHLPSFGRLDHPTLHRSRCYRVSQREPTRSHYKFARSYCPRIYLEDLPSKPLFGP